MQTAWCWLTFLPKILQIDGLSALGDMKCKRTADICWQCVLQETRDYLFDCIYKVTKMYEYFLPFKWIILNRKELIGTTISVTFLTRFCKTRCRYSGVRMYFMVTAKRYFYFCTYKVRTGKKWMTTGTNCIILTATLRIGNQMWLIIYLYVLFFFLMFRFFLLGSCNFKQWL